MPEPEPELDRQILSRIAVDRRAFIKRAILGAAFVAPVVASFEMSRLSSDAEAARTPYGTTQRQRLSHRSSYYPRNLRHHSTYADASHESHTEY